MPIRKQRNKSRSNVTDISPKTIKRVVRETIHALQNNNLGMLAASIAYGGTLAFFPLVAASVAIASLAIQPDQLSYVVESMTQYMPKDIASLITTQITNAANDKTSSIWVAVVAIALAVFGVSGAMNSMVGAVNVAYGIKETRNFIKVRLLSIGLTALMIIGMMLIIPLVFVGGELLRYLQVPEAGITAFSFLRWMILIAVVSIGLAIFYRFAPNRERGKWQWISWGSVIATLLWLLGTVLFFIYIQYFAGLSDSYSLFAGIVALMLWLNFGGLVILIGAQVNKSLETRSR